MCPVTVMPAACAASMTAADRRLVQQRIELHLLEARLLVACDRGASFVRVRGGDVAERRRARAVDEAGEQQPRPDRLAVVPRVAQRRDDVELAAHVARGGHAGGEIHRTPLREPDVRVHVPQARQDRLAARRRRRGTPRGTRRRGRRARRRDAAVADDDRGVLDRRRAGRVDQPPPVSANVPLLHAARRRALRSPPRASRSRTLSLMKGPARRARAPARPPRTPARRRS